MPTAEYQVFRDAARAATFVRDREDVPVVVKADGLAAGKGVFVCKGRNEAIAAVERIGRERAFGDAGNQIVIEERLDGHEVSVLAMTDGRTIITLPPRRTTRPRSTATPGRTPAAWAPIARRRW